MKRRLISLILAMSMLICMSNFGIVNSQGEENNDVDVSENVTLPEFEDKVTKQPVYTTPEPTELIFTQEPVETPESSEPQETIPSPALLDNNAGEEFSRQIEINVATQDGIIVPNADVSVDEDHAVSDSNGVAHFDSIPVGKHILKVYAAGYRYKETVFVIPGNSKETYEHNTYLIQNESELMLLSDENDEETAYSEKVKKYSENFDYADGGGFNISYSRSVDGSVGTGVPVTQCNGYIYCFDSDATFAYNISNDSWSIYPVIPTYRAYAGVAAIGDIIYVIGGAGPNAAGNEVQAFNTNTKTWSQKSNMPQTGSYFNAHAVNGNIYIGGGIVSGNPAGSSPSDSSGEVSLYKYSPENDQWTIPVQKGEIHSLKGRVSTAANGRIYFTAGHDWYADQHSNDVYIYDTIDETWKRGEIRPSNSDNIGIFGGIFTNLGSCLYYQGGTSWFGGDDEGHKYTTEDRPCLYDPYYDSWMEFNLYDEKYKLDLVDYQLVTSYGSTIFIPENDNDSFRLKKVSIFNSYVNSPEMYRDHNIAIGNSYILKVEDGKVMAKGKNDCGQLGNGTNIDSEDFTEVKAVWGNKRIAKAETRANTSYALTEDGVLYGWGDNSSAQLGDGTYVNKNVPVEILTGISDITAGVEHASALRQESSVPNYRIYSWGSNKEKQINDENKIEYYNLPYGTDNGEIVEAGSYQTYRYNSLGRSFCATGKNDKGQLGGSIPNPFNYLNDYDNVKKIATGANHTAMICNDNQLYVFGDNTYGQLGRNLGENETYSSAPIRTGIYPENVFAGGNSTAYVLQGEVYQAGQVFDGNNASFKKVENTKNINEVAVGDKFSIGVDVNKTLWRWGSLTDDSSFELKSSKKYQKPLKSEYIYDFIDIDSQRAQTIGINSEGKVIAWGTGYYGDGTDKEVKHNAPHEIVLGDGVIPKAVERGKNFNLVLDTEGNVWGFGSNTNKPMGGMAGKYKVPTKISDISDVKQITAGDGFSIFLKNDGTLWGMGANNLGQLCQGNNTDSKVPVQITDKNNFTKVSAGDSFVAAIAGNEVYTWGEGTDGQLGNGPDSSANTPQKLQVSFDEPYEKFVDIKTSVNYCIALTNKGNVYSWGRNASGQLGHGDKVSRNIPAKVPGLSDIKSVFAENLQSFAIKNDGTVYAWGNGSNYQLGLNKTGTQQSPAVVTSLSGKEITEIVCGNGYSIALSRYGYMYSFGSNIDGCMPVYSEEAQKYSSIEIEDMRWLRKYMSDNIGNNITENISLPAEGPKGSKITWTSSHEGYISSTGEVHRPDAYGKDTDVTLTAAIGQYDDGEKARFDLTVLQDASIKPSTDVPIRSIGMEYDQMYPETAPDVYPEITAASMTVIDESKGIYQLTIRDDQYRCSEKAAPFFFWNARQGTFLPVDGCDDYRSVQFTVDPDALGKQIKVIVGIGDSLGYIDRKSILIQTSGSAETSVQAADSENIMTLAMENELTQEDISKDIKETGSAVTLAIGIDNSADMQKFDQGSTKRWASLVEGLKDSANKGTEIVLVDDTNYGYAKDTESAKNSLGLMMSKEYSGTTDAETMLARCEEALNAEESISTNGNKVITLFVQKITDKTALEEKIEELNNKGIAVYVMLLGGGYEGSREEIINCETELNLRLNISELYGAFNNISQVMSLSENGKASPVALDEYTSDFRIGKHNFSNMTESNYFGGYIASILNIYGCLPAFTNKYNLFDVSIDDVYNLMQGNAAEITKESTNKISNFYNDFSSYTTIGIEEVIKHNLKYRFPVIVQADDKTYLITKTNNNTYTAYKNNDFTKPVTLEINDINGVIDTYSYLIEISQKTSITDEQDYTSAFYDKIRFNVPSGYSKEDINFKKYPSGNTNTNITVSGNKATITGLNDGEIYLCGIKTTFTKNVPNIYNSTKIYKVIQYQDERSANQWYYTYLFAATNKGIINGDQQSDGTLIFNAEGEITRAQLIKTILCATGIMSDDSVSEGKFWATNYFNKAIELGMVDYTDISSESTYQYFYEDGVSRRETANIMTGIMIEHAEENKVPSLLYQFDTNISCLKNALWTDGKVMTDVGKISDTENYGIYQMYMNGIMDGNPNGTFEPNSVLTRAQICKIIMKSLFHLDGEVPEIWADIDGDENITEINANTDGYKIDAIEFGLNNKRQYKITLTDDLNLNTKFIIRTTGDLGATTLTGELKNAETGESISQSVMNGDNNLYYKVTAGVYDFVLTKNGNATVGLEITYVNAPQEVIFNQNATNSDGTKNHYIFDDHPEFILRCDILNDRDFEASSLTKAEKLEPGTYTVFAYHHVANNTTANKYTKGAAFSNDEQVYFDSAFFNMNSFAGKVGKVTITKLGMSHMISQGSWSNLYDTWNDFQNNISMTVFEGHEENSVKMLSQLQNKLYNINYNADSGFVWLMMEFKVENCTVSYADVAYKKESNTTIENTRNSVINNIPNSKCSYETLETVKGIGNASQVIEAKPMEYIIDENTKDMLLPVYVKNQLNGMSRQQFFTTNMSPFTTNNRYTTPESSEISIALPYGGVIRNSENGAIESTVIPNNSEEKWIFDTEHSKQTVDTALPDEFKVGSYSEKEYIKPGEKFDNNWMHSIVGKDNTAFETFQGKNTSIDPNSTDNMTRAVVQGMNGFGVTHKYRLKITNISEVTKKFSYVLQGMCYTVNYSINSTIPGKTPVNGLIEKNVPYWVWLSTECFNYDISPGETAIINIETTLMTGSNPTLHNAFVIDGDIKYYTINKLDENNEIISEHSDIYYKNLLDKIQK